MEYLVTFLFLVAAHYVTIWNFLPWKMPHPVRIILNYVTGTVGMLAPFVWWLWTRGETEIIIKLVWFVVAAGLAPVFSYLNDAALNNKNRANEAEEREKLLSNNVPK